MPPSADAAPPLSKAATHVRQSVFAALQGRIDAHRKKGGTLIPLQIGDTHLAPPGSALAVRSDPKDLNVYGQVGGLPELREAIAAFRRTRGLTTAAGMANVHVGCGCTHALFCAVPGARKRAAVKAALEGPISTDCPASILRTHRNCTIYLDREAAPHG